ncbi:MAG: DUF4965 domain-containing protein [Proteobacteria bacterium]|nr:DUF4965 domain-containing protein [Pseudomonadota bacterium]
MMAPLRPPAVPLITIDPYTSCWSFADNLYDQWPRHWTGTEFALCGLARVDGKPLRFMGGPEVLVDSVRQLSVEVQPTRTIYKFEAGAVELEVTFISPLLLDDLELLSRPASYVWFRSRSLDGAAHEVAVYLDMTSQWAVNVPHQKVMWKREEADELLVLSFRHELQPVLQKAGDDVRIDWGTALLAVPRTAEAIVGDIDYCRAAFVARGALSAEHLLPMPRKSTYWGEAVLAVKLDVSCSAQRAGEGVALVGYDDEYAVEYFGEPLRAWWRRHPEASPQRMLNDAYADAGAVRERCAVFDAHLVSEAERVGGDKYASLAALAYRQAISACKLVAAPDGRAFFFSKENFSNACMGTLDVNYKSAPLFLYANPELMKGMLDPIFDYCRSDKWRHPFPAHDLGLYPKANGQVYKNFHLPDQTEVAQMPVEECGNMLTLTTAVCLREGHAKYAAGQWDQLTQWTDYLVEHGLDPEAQLVTDDFTGMMGHSVNLSAKSVVAIACYALLAKMQGRDETATKYRAIAEDYAARWQNMADDGDHYRLAFDRPGSWSQKYNLAWDTVFGLELFPPEVMRKELAYYRSQRLGYGTPLDSRSPAAKPEWAIWVATMAESKEVFEEFLAPIHRYVNETPNRVPVADIYFAHTGRRRANQARSVVGGFYMKLLADRLAQVRAGAITGLRKSK